MGEKKQVKSNPKCGIRLYNVPFGGKRGMKLTKLCPKKKASNKRGRLSASAKFHRSLVREIVGFAPFERRILELLKTDREKRAFKFAKARIGGHKRAKKKREEMQEVIIEMRK
ncbi:60S ribosomal protein L36 [Cichlidogyrus casuarinus]|uniref:Large ribosomal subunit protein eL36 n=1 Tax=Cichlidogyrus casuarinus TaxID=1844966 RepID=A0ABD2QL82_9PLAT